MRALRKRIFNKLSSARGASLTMALLLFLVCAVVGSVVLAAGTAAAGRISERAQSDQRYFAVTSAAELLARELDGKSVTIVREETTTTTKVKTYTVGWNAVTGEETVGTPSEDSSTVTTYTTAVKSALPGGTDTALENKAMGGNVPKEVGVELNFLAARGVKLLFGAEACNTEAAMACSFPSGAVEPATALELLPSLGEGVTGISAEELASLAVSCTYELKSDGTLVFRLSDQPGDGDRFTAVLTLQPSFDRSERTAKSGGGSPTVTPTSSGYTETTASSVTRTVTATVTWSVASIES